MTSNKASLYPNIFFFFTGLYGLYTWNSTINLNSYFVEVFQNPTIAKTYGLVYMIVALSLLWLNFYLGKNCSVYTVSTVIFVVLYGLFHLNYFVTQYVTNESAKLVIFLISMGAIGFCTSCYVSLVSGLSLRFGDNPFIFKNIGISTGALITNFLAALGVWFTKKYPIKYLYLMYMCIGDIGIFGFFFFKLYFYKLCKQNFYTKDKKPEEIEMMNLKGIL